MKKFAINKIFWKKFLTKNYIDKKIHLKNGSQQQQKIHWQILSSKNLNTPQRIDYIPNIIENSSIGNAQKKNKIKKGKILQYTLQ